MEPVISTEVMAYGSGRSGLSRKALTCRLLQKRAAAVDKAHLTEALNGLRDDVKEVKQEVRRGGKP